MTAKEYLQQLQKYKRTAQLYAERIEELYHEATGIKAIVYDKDRVQVSPEDRMEKIFMRIDSEAEKYTKARARYDREVRKRVEMIASLENPAHVELLTLRYVDGLKWEEIACAMGYTWRHTLRIHGDALDAFKRKMS